MGIAIGLLVVGCLVAGIVNLGAVPSVAEPAVEVSVRQLGEQLMTEYVLPLEAMAVLLTAALIGAVVLAMEPRSGGDRLAAGKDSRRRVIAGGTPEKGEGR